MLIYGCHPCEEYINSTLLHRKHKSGWRKSRECKKSEQSEAAETGKGAEQGKAAEAPHEQVRTKKSLKPDWEEAGAGTAAEAYPKQYNHDNDK